MQMCSTCTPVFVVIHNAVNIMGIVATIVIQSVYKHGRKEGDAIYDKLVEGSHTDYSEVTMAINTFSPGS